MRVQQLEIKNFRGISTINTGPLGNTIIVAGQNGSGKTCIFDGIRFLKSLYGGYQQNEYQHFFTEFQIALQGGATNLKGLFNNSEKPINIRCLFELSDREKQYISENVSELVEEVIWQKVLPEAFQFGGYRKAMFASQFRDKKPDVIAQVLQIRPLLLNELSAEFHVGQVIMSPGGEMNIVPSHVLPVVFSTYRPGQIGVIDFHGAQRHYNRESVSGINLNLEQANQTRSQSSLYNHNAKYSNVKSEMAGNYIKALLSETASPQSGPKEPSLAEAMAELFVSFFPDKKFLGPRPTLDGSLAFPVETQNGSIHDLDELSSGEKEILYGYLRIRSSAPRDSIVLLDEPELHLNPRLIRGLPEFYRRHLSDKLHNQLWLVTHSDALIREAVGKPGFNVFHMQPCGVEIAGDSQLKALVEFKDLDLVLTDLVGDLAAYRPGGKGVIFEGGGDSDFDRTLVEALFTEEMRGINLISGSNKAKVRALHQVLASAHSKGHLPTKFFCVVDKDTGRKNAAPDGITEFEWGVYHIENYLLNPDFISETFNTYSLSSPMSTSQADAKLAQAARGVVPLVVANQLRDFANSSIVSELRLGFSPASSTMCDDLKEAIDGSFKRIAAAVNALSLTEIQNKEADLRRNLEASFADGSWREKIPGREILKAFVQSEQIPTSYEAFRNQVVSRMAEKSYKPQGMLPIIRRIQEG